jgi:F-type H+-transporting ATPase subunit gamma
MEQRGSNVARQSPQGVAAMTRRQDLELHRHSLDEIREIMNSMKTLAYMEIRKLSRFLSAQVAVVRSIEDAAADFISFYPGTMPQVDDTTRVFLLIGTERGFCGDFNQSLVHHIESTLRIHPAGQSYLIAIGRKLHTLMENNPHVVATIDGAGVAEEVTTVLNQMVQALSSLQKQHGILTVYGLYHGGTHGIVVQKLLPPFQQYLHQPPQFRHPPALNMPPAEFFLELTEQYLFAALYEMLYTSLMAENHNRVTHLEEAVKHLNDKSEDLTRQCAALRQEEIIEEIEVILLSAGSVDEYRHQRKTHDKVRTKKESG